MQEWQSDHLELLLNIHDEKILFQELILAARCLGFDYCAYGLRTPLPISHPRVVMLNNYPAGWQNRYDEMGYLTIDPTVQHGEHSSLPLLWSSDLFHHAREFWEEARSFGLHYGWAQSSRDTQGLRGLLTLARSCEPISEVELRENVPKMVWLTQIAHIGMARCLSTKLQPTVEVQLTERERSVLRWTADGKTSWEVSEILGITERTVNFHINNAVKKLGTSNKLAASVHAAMMGIL